MKMVFRLVFKSAILLAVVGAIELVMLFSPLKPEDPAHDYLDEWQIKHRLLTAPGQDRLVLAGGSNFAFGVDSTKVESASQRPTVNLSLHAGLGLQFMLNEIARDARRGDIVVLSAEYDQFFGDLMYGELAATELLRGNPAALCCMTNWRQWARVAVNLPSANSQAFFDRVSWLAHGLVGSPRRQYADPAYVYRKDAFDLRGDMIGHLGLAPDLAHFTQEIRTIYGDLNPEAFEAIARCGRALEARGVRFIAVYPVIARSYWNLNREKIHQVASHMPEKWIVTTPEAWVYEDKMFYDTPHHLDRTGRELRTAQLIGAILGSDGDTALRAVTQ